MPYTLSTGDKYGVLLLDLPAIHLLLKKDKDVLDDFVSFIDRRYIPCIGKDTLYALRFSGIIERFIDMFSKTALLFIDTDVAAYETDRYFHYTAADFAFKCFKPRGGNSSTNLRLWCEEFMTGDKLQAETRRINSVCEYINEVYMHKQFVIFPNFAAEYIKNYIRHRGSGQGQARFDFSAFPSSYIEAHTLYGYVRSKRKKVTRADVCTYMSHGYLPFADAVLTDRATARGWKLLSYGVECLADTEIYDKIASAKKK